MKTVNIYEAKTNLSKLLELVANGENIIIAKAGKPVADLTPHKPKQSVKFGLLPNLKFKDEDFVGVDPDIQEMFYGKNWDK